MSPSPSEVHSALEALDNAAMVLARLDLAAVAQWDELEATGIEPEGYAETHQLHALAIERLRGLKRFLDLV